MDRFGKLFGRKAEQGPTDDNSTLESPVPPTAREVSPAHTPPVQTAADAAYGLKFVFDSGESRTFTRLPVRIGRSEENDLVLSEDTVSANHALVYFDEHLREICIQDLDSLNGLFISDQPTRKNILQDGARIGLGSTHLVYRDTGYIHPA